MIEVTDEDIAEALRLCGYNYPKRSIQDFRESEQNEFGHAREILAILPKLRVAVEALESIADNYNGYAITIASTALTQIKDTGQ